MADERQDRCSSSPATATLLGVIAVADVGEARRAPPPSRACSAMGVSHASCSPATTSAPPQAIQRQRGRGRGDRRRAARGQGARRARSSGRQGARRHGGRRHQRRAGARPRRRGHRHRRGHRRGHRERRHRARCRATWPTCRPRSQLSRATLRNIKQNLFWALVYNAVCIPVAAGVLAASGVDLNPMIAAAAMWPELGVRGGQRPAPASLEARSCCAGPCRRGRPRRRARGCQHARSRWRARPRRRARGLQVRRGRLRPAGAFRACDPCRRGLWRERT